jgi:hypothetical protein
VGRLFINLRKVETPSRWEKLVRSGKFNNMHTWWEMHEQHQKELVKFKRFDIDDVPEEPKKRVPIDEEELKKLREPKPKPKTKESESWDLWSYNPLTMLYNWWY